MRTLLIALILLAGRLNAQTMQTQTATIIINADIEKVFPLFGAYEEKKWARGWEPTPVYPITETIEEGATFRTPGHLPGENEYIWRVSKYDNRQHLVQYMVYVPDRCWTITVQCAPVEGRTAAAESRTTAAEGRTAATISYAFVALNPAGEEKNKHSLHLLFQHQLKDWEEEINTYLSK